MKQLQVYKTLIVLIFKIQMAIKFLHLLQIKQTYFEHMRNALKYSATCQKASALFFIHAFFPDTYVNNGSNTISELNRKLNEHNKTDKVMQE